MESFINNSRIDFFVCHTLHHRLAFPENFARAKHTEELFFDVI